MSWIRAFLELNKWRIQGRSATRFNEAWNTS